MKRDNSFEKGVISYTLLTLAIVALVWLMPYDTILNANYKVALIQHKQLVKAISLIVPDAIDMADEIYINGAINRAIKINRFTTINDVDINKLVPLECISVDEQSAVRKYINDTKQERGYASCVLIEYTYDTELDGSCYHFVWDDKHYTCIYISEGHNKPLLLYDTELNEELVGNWDIV